MSVSSKANPIGANLLHAIFAPAVRSHMLGKYCDGVSSLHELPSIYVKECRSAALGEAVRLGCPYNQVYINKTAGHACCIDYISHVQLNVYEFSINYPDGKAHGANMGPILGR